jgi:hypothetical protein
MPCLFHPTFNITRESRVCDFDFNLVTYFNIQKEKAKDLDVNYSAKGTTIVLFSGELDKAVAALIIANGARAAGKDVTIFFTFWGLNALKKAHSYILFGQH